jgi:hypothetical protein
METDSREARTEAHPMSALWGTASEARESFHDGAAFWLAGGASLLFWTALVLLLTSA